VVCEGFQEDGEGRGGGRCVYAACKLEPGIQVDGGYVCAGAKGYFDAVDEAEHCRLHDFRTVGVSGWDSGAHRFGRERVCWWLICGVLKVCCVRGL
jgi:hypothetical protein